MKKPASTPPASRRLRPMSDSTSERDDRMETRIVSSPKPRAGNDAAR
jgi:hypothetical protein